MKNCTIFAGKFLILCIFCICSYSLQAQNKSHFRVLENGVEVQNTPYHLAVAEMDMDIYRYVSTRRQMPIQGTNFVIELFSGDELWTMYQKRISPNNKTLQTDSYPHTGFVFYPVGNRFKTVIE